MNAPSLSDWTGANRKYVAAELARLRALLGDGDLAEAETEVGRRRGLMPAPPAVDALVGLFGLSGFERDVLLLACGAEMDARLADLCAGTGRGVSFGLALSALPDAHWSALAPIAPLRRWRLVEPEEAQGLTQARLRADERILHFVGGLSYTDPRIAPLLREVAAPGLMDAVHRDAAEAAARALRTDAGVLPTILLDGDDAEGQHDAAALIAGALGLTLMAMSAADVAGAAREQETLATLWQREAMLTGAGLMLEAGADAGEAVTRFAERLDGFLAIAGQAAPPRARPTLRLRIDRAEPAGQRALWFAALGARADELAPVVETLAGQHRLSARRIAGAADDIAGMATEAAARRLRTLPRDRAPRLDGLAHEIIPRAGWEDIVLPEAQMRTLGQISIHLRLRNRVHEDWGFADKGGRGLGLATLFWGDSGTGKTLAAEVLARELDLPLYRIDLSAVVSKYIGETEKNLARVFDAAEENAAHPAFRRGRRAVRQAQRGQGQPRPLRQHRGQLPVAADGVVPRPSHPDDQPQGGAGPRVPAAAAVHRPLPVPRRPAPRGDLAGNAARGDAGRGAGLREAGAAGRGGRDDPQHRPERRIPRRRCGNASHHVAHPPRGAHGRGQARNLADRR